MEAYRYTLEKSSRKHLCPECNKLKFVRYIDTETKEYLPDQYGRCDREINCAYHLNPYTNGYSDFQNNRSGANYTSNHGSYNLVRSHAKPLAYIPVEILKQTRQGWEHNTFLQNLLNNIPYPFSPNEIEKVIVQYQLGTILKGYMSGAVTFPYIDEQNNICAVQAKKFDKSNHTTTTSFLHFIVEKNLKFAGINIPDWLRKYKENDSKVNCLFGAHLLAQYPKNPIALVEAPKSAIIGTLYYGFPDVPVHFLWLAVYNLSSLSLEKCRVLKGRTVILFPDLSKEGTAFLLWSEKAKTMEKQLPGTSFTVCDLLEQKAGKKARSKGYDLADYLIQFDHRTFRNPLPSPAFIAPSLDTIIPANQPQSSIHTSSDSHIPTLSNYHINTFSNLQIPTFSNPFTQQLPIQNTIWDIAPLESFFNSILLPSTPIRLDQCSVIHDLPKFISGHLEILHTYNGNPVFLPYLKRLQKLRLLLESAI